MVKLLLSFLLLWNVNFRSAQIPKVNDKAAIVVILNNKGFLLEKDVFRKEIKPEWLSLVNIVPPKLALEKYGPQAKDGAVEMHLKKDVPSDLEKKLEQLTKVKKEYL